MEHYEMTQNGGELSINGIPDAVCIKKLPISLGKVLSDFSMHQGDLQFAKHNLDSINKVGVVDDSYLQETLWRSAIIHFIKCFTSSTSRGQLSFEKVYKGKPVEAKEAFDYFKNLRNKTIAHDENAYSQSISGVALNNGCKNYKAEKIVFIRISAQTLVNDNYANLNLLVSNALDYVNNKLEEMFNDITGKVELMSYDNLMKLDDVHYNVPTLEDVAKSRGY